MKGISEHIFMKHNENYAFLLLLVFCAFHVCMWSWHLLYVLFKYQQAL
jgi:hypothetical protein